MVKVSFAGAQIKYTDDYIISDYNYNTTEVREMGYDQDGDIKYSVSPLTTPMTFKTERKIPKTGVMMVGWGGNNGSTFTAVVLANKHRVTWETKNGVLDPNYYGSLVMGSTVCVGTIPSKDPGSPQSTKLCIPMFDMLPFLDPNTIEIDGWDISSLDLASSMKRASVLDVDLQRKLSPYMSQMKPRPSVFNGDYLASNQAERADNVLSGSLKEKLDHIRADIRDFKAKKQLDKIIVLWTASTERFTDLKAGIHDSEENLLKAIDSNLVEEISPSALFAVASILEKCAFINGSPQNTIYKGVVELATKNQVFIAGDDFKTGQTKLKSVLVEFLLNSGIKPVSIVSYNHLGNNDGKNLSSQKQFRSKEITKSGVIDELIQSNSILYKPNEHPDHCIVIKYIPYVKDSKRAMDEYISEICMHGLNTLAIHNTCEDSLLATTVMLDLIILCELFQRITVKIDSLYMNGKAESFQHFNIVLSTLSLLLKAPLTSCTEPMMNGFSAQRNCIENIIRACLGIPPQNHMYIEDRFKKNNMKKL